MTPVTIKQLELSQCAGCPAIESHSLLAVRSDGARANRSLRTGKHNTGREARNVLLPDAREYVVIADAIQAKSTFYISSADAERAKTVAVYPRCEDPSIKDNQFVGVETVLGFKTCHYVQESLSEIPADGATSRINRWLAPELDCRTLKFTRELLAADGGVLRTFERSATAVVLGEPDPSHFDVPAAYREVPPSEASRNLSRAAGRPLETDPARETTQSPGLQRMDDKYWSSRADRP